MKGINLIKKVMVIAFVMSLAVNCAFAAGLYPKQIIVAPSGRLKVVKGFFEEWTVPVLVYSNSDENVFITKDSIAMNLGLTMMGTDYLRTGNFAVRLYIEFKGDTLKQRITELQKAKRNSLQPEDHKYIHPELLKCKSQNLYVSVQQKKMEVRKQIYIDRDGDVIVERPDIPTLDLDPLSLEIAKNIISVFEIVKKDPKIADQLDFY
jgi:hypothetical protein